MCTVRNVAINTDQIRVAKGGVPLKTFMGQQEAVEFPTFEQQCTMQSVDPSIVSIMRSSILDAWKTLQLPPQCTHRFEGVTLVFTRDSYANYYHHILMWYLVYVAQQTLGVVPSRILLVDDHPAASLDVTWKQLFAPHLFISDVAAHSCFDELVIMPFERTSPLWTREEHHLCPKDKHVAAFRSYLLQLLHLELWPPTQTIVVTLILRKDHMSHPRKNGWMSRRITNEKEVVEIQPHLRSPYRLDFHVVSYERVSLREQVATMMDSNVVVGVHGAGLTSTLFLRPGSVLMELNVYHESYFRNMAKLTGVQYLNSQSGSM